MSHIVITALIAAGSSIIVGVLTLIGVLVSNNAHDAVIDEKIAELTREVRRHNNFAERLPVVENDIKNLYRKYDALAEIKALESSLESRLK